MSETFSRQPDEANKGEMPSPYNLEDFPAYQEELTKRARTVDQREQVEQTFSPENPGNLEVLTDPDISRVMSSVEHEEEFDKLYPALDKVMSIHEQRMHDARLGLLRQEAAVASREALVRQHSYLGYWKEVAGNAEREGDAVLWRVAGRNEAHLRNLERLVLDDTARLSAASEWYLSLGSFSRLKGAEEMLAYAAHLPLDTRKGSTYPHSRDEQLLLSGAMLSEASLVNSRYGDRDLDKQHAYEAAARERFQRILDADKGAESGGGIVRQARVYKSDMTMREAHRMALAAAMSGDKELAELAKKTGREAIADLAECIVTAQAEMQRTRNPEIVKEIRGELVERAILMLLRENAVIGGKLAQEVPYQAFPRQDYPLDSYAGNGLPRAAFDVVQRRFMVDSEGRVGELEVPIQAKNRSGDKVYDPRIVVLANANGQVGEIVREVARMSASPQVAKMAAAGMQERAAALRHKIDTEMAHKRARAQR